MSISLRLNPCNAVTPRMRRVSWNVDNDEGLVKKICHASHEACELKYARKDRIDENVSHASHEACELKFYDSFAAGKLFMSRLAWGVWVEMTSTKFRKSPRWVTPRMRRVSWNAILDPIECTSVVTPRMRRVSWNNRISCRYQYSEGHASHEACELKFLQNFYVRTLTGSRLAWGVWVEMIPFSRTHICKWVTPRMRRVSWNYAVLSLSSRAQVVTPRMRRVSWNYQS